ncbi:MAG: COX15/CtaA family protein [Gammaproteobacteria bacterium]|nr:COX15/CtaA family protein [Gammaproteobacteria bacterium]
MRNLAVSCLLLVVTLVSVSAYLRLQNSGIGCADWPECYGRIGQAASEAPTLGSTYERLAVDAQAPLSWATPVHRLVASILGLLVLARALLSIRQRRERLLSFTLLGLTVFLAWLGIYSEGLHSPAIVMGNLGGGFAMLGLLSWSVFRGSKPRSNAPTSVRYSTGAAIVLLIIQIGIGGFTSANFAASACQTLPDCHGSYWPGRDLPAAFDLTRTHEIGPTGVALGGAERTDIHKLHRLAAVVTVLVAVVAGGLGIRAGLGVTAAAVIVLVATEFSLGIAAIFWQLPVGIAVAHNWIAAILLLTLIRLLALCRNQQALM